MKKRLLLLSTIFLTLAACSTTVTDINLKNGWRACQGDDPVWASAEFNDSDWDTIQVGNLWENSGWEGYDGIAWYRNTLFIDSEMKNGLEKEQDFLLLKLGKIDDADEIFWNGEMIAATGNFSENDGVSYSLDRSIKIPLEKIIWDKNNLLAVRVNDFGGGGGLYQGPYGLFSTDWADNVDITIDVPEHEDHIFQRGDSVRIAFTLKNNSNLTYKMKVKMNFQNDRHEPFSWHTKAVRLAGNGTETLTFVQSVDEVGFYEAAYECFAKGKATVKEGIEYYGCEPAKIDAETSMPVDFEEYWNKAREELKKVDPQFIMTRVPQYDTDYFEVYEVMMHSWGNTRVNGWYAKPKGDGKYPALIMQTGYSYAMPPQTDREGFAILAFNIRGHGNSIMDVNPGFPQYITTNITDTENYIYKAAYMDCIRAIDFICSRPEVDTSRIGVYGGSQGGALSFASAALDRRIKACAPHVPFLSNFRTYFQLAAFPRIQFEQYLYQNPEISWDDVYATLDYIDIRNLAPWIECPILMGVGLRDQTCPPYTNFSAFNNVKSEDKEWYIYADYAHAVSPQHHAYEVEWFKKQFGMIPTQKN